MNIMTNIILCGGSGTRLWPLSRTSMPKQFLKLFDGKSLFQQTLDRNDRICANRIIVSGNEHYFTALDQLSELKMEGSFLLEPTGRNTAPAIALACLGLPQDEIVFVAPSDHLIKDHAAYEKAVEEAYAFASEGNLVVFGIKPQHAETGFGYIEADERRVKAFHEKPDSVTAKRYLESGRYYWNSGMFCFRVGTYLSALEQYAPELYSACTEAYASAQKEDGMTRIMLDKMEAIPSNSIDYAVLEKAEDIMMVPADFGWSDMGSFDALSDVIGSDVRGNTVIAEKHVELIDMDDTVVVDTSDALLVVKKGSTQQVKRSVEKLLLNRPDLIMSGMTGYRPWGEYTILDASEGYKIKRIVVKPGRRLSLQKHYHRNEHWIVLSGSATVTVGDRTFVVNPNESTYIRAGEVHRLENRGKLPLVIIEVQVGEYTGEDDIVRIEDDYKRIYE